MMYVLYFYQNNPYHDILLHPYHILIYIYDIRDWASEHEKMGKGITLTIDEAKVLLDVLSSEL